VSQYEEMAKDCAGERLVEFTDELVQSKSERRPARTPFAWFFADVSITLDVSPFLRGLPEPARASSCM